MNIYTVNFVHFYERCTKTSSTCYVTGNMLCVNILCGVFLQFQGKRSTETRWKGSSWAQMEKEDPQRCRIRLKLDECIHIPSLFASFRPYSQDKYFTHNCSSAEFLEIVMEKPEAVSSTACQQPPPPPLSLSSAVYSRDDLVHVFMLLLRNA